MLDLKYNETMLSKVEKGRVAHSSPSDGKQSGGVSCAKMMKQDIHMKIGEVIMVQTIKISSKEMKLINDLLNLTGDEIYQKWNHKHLPSLLCFYRMQDHPRETQGLYPSDSRRKFPGKAYKGWLCETSLFRWCRRV